MTTDLTDDLISTQVAIVGTLIGTWPDKLGTIPTRQHELPFEDIQVN
jgi:hypothetical protein